MQGSGIVMFSSYGPEIKNGKNIFIIRNFSADAPTEDRVNVWCREVLEAAEAPVLEECITLADIELLKWPLAEDFQRLFADKPDADWITSERIETYQKLHSLRRRLESLLIKIISADKPYQ